MPRHRLGALAALLALALLVLPAPAHAHERRDVGDGYRFVVGFLTEPAFEGEANGIDLRVMRAADETPVEGVEQTLKAEVIVGPNTMPITLRPRFGQPGAYNGEFVPTRSGPYTFRFTGTINGQPINETFESGPGRFNDVQATAPLQFPDKLPTAADLQRAAAAAESRATTALLVGAGGLAVGLLGLALAAWALLQRRGAAAPARAPSQRTPASAGERL